MCHDVSPQALTRPRDRGNLSTSRAPWAYSPNAEGVLTPRHGHSRGTRRAYSPCALGVLTLRPGRTHSAPWAYSPCALGVLAALDECTPHVLTARTLPHRGPRGARGEHRHGRALDAVRVDEELKHAAPWAYPALALGVPAARRGLTRQTPWAYSALALGVPTALRGRTHPTQRAYLHRAMGTVAVRAGRTRPAPWAYSPCALGVLTARPGRTHRARRVHAACPHRANTAPSRPARSAR